MSEREQLRSIISRGFDHLAAISQSIEKIEAEAKDTEDIKKRSAGISMVFAAINDILHSAYGIAPSLFPEKDISEFIKVLQRVHKDAVDKKLFPPCPCKECKNESTSRNTDKTE